MSKSIWKFNYICSSFYKNIFLNKFKNSKIFKVFSRSSTIPNFLIKKTTYVYKGNIPIKIIFSKYTLGYKTGEFGVTRKPFNFPKKNKKKK